MGNFAYHQLDTRCLYRAYVRVLDKGALRTIRDSKVRYEMTQRLYIK